MPSSHHQNVSEKGEKRPNPLEKCDGLDLFHASCRNIAVLTKEGDFIPKLPLGVDDAAADIDFITLIQFGNRNGAGIHTVAAGQAHQFYCYGCLYQLFLHWGIGGTPLQVDLRPLTAGRYQNRIHGIAVFIQLIHLLLQMQPVDGDTAYFLVDFKFLIIGLVSCQHQIGKIIPPAISHQNTAG